MLGNTVHILLINSVRLPFCRVSLLWPKNNHMLSDRPEIKHKTLLWFFLFVCLSFLENYWKIVVLARRKFWFGLFLRQHFAMQSRLALNLQSFCLKLLSNGSHSWTFTPGTNSRVHFAFSLFLFLRQNLM